MDDDNLVQEAKALLTSKDTPRYDANRTPPLSFPARHVPFYIKFLIVCIYVVAVSIVAWLILGAMAS